MRILGKGGPSGWRGASRAPGHCFGLGRLAISSILVGCLYVPNPDFSLDESASTDSVGTSTTGAAGSQSASDAGNESTESTESTGSSTYGGPTQSTAGEDSGSAWPPGTRVSDGLRLLYVFAPERNDTVVVDRSGYAPPLDLSLAADNPFWGTGFLHFDGTFQAMADDLVGPERLVATNSYTLEMWVEHKGPPEVDSSIIQDGPRLFAFEEHGDAPELVNIAVMQIETSVEVITAFLYRPGTTTLSIITPPGLHQYVFIRESGGAIRAYVDGVYITGVQDSSPELNWQPRPLSIGGNTDDQHRWTGDYWSLAFYDRALSGEEIEANFEAGPNATP